MWEYRYGFNILFSFPLGIYPEIELLDNTVVLCLSFWQSSVLFFIVAAPIIFPPTMCKSCLFSSSSPTPNSCPCHDSHDSRYDVTSTSYPSSLLVSIWVEYLFPPHFLSMGFLKLKWVSNRQYIIGYIFKSIEPVYVFCLKNVVHLHCGFDLPFPDDLCWASSFIYCWSFGRVV